MERMRLIKLVKFCQMRLTHHGHSHGPIYTLETSKPSPTIPGVRDPPDNYAPCEWIHKFENVCGMPYAVFRDTSCDCILGPSASKCDVYKNPEYYSYHKYSHTTMHEFLKNCRAYECLKYPIKKPR